jgi:hypothetical protein
VKFSGARSDRTFRGGANRSFYAADRGTETKWPGGGDPEREGLIGRQVPTRPAHFFKRLYKSVARYFLPGMYEKYLEHNDARMKGAVKALADALPKPPGFDPNSSVEEKLHAGIFEYADRLAEQYAFEVPNRFFKADVSSSNFELDGKIMDYDSMTAQAHYVELITPIQDRLGDTETLKVRLLSHFETALADYSPELAKNFPLMNVLGERFDIQYKMRRERNFVELTGLPRDLVQRLMETPEGKAQISELGSLLDKIAFTGSELFRLEDKMPSKAPTYDLARILMDLSSKNPLDRKALEQAIAKDLPDPELRQSLLGSYQRLMLHAAKVSEADGIHLPALQKFTYENAKLRNADISDMHRAVLRKENQDLVDEYRRTGNRSIIWNSILKRIRKNRRVYKSDDPYQLIVDEIRDPVTGITSRQVYNARTDRFEVVIRAKIYGDKARFFSNEIPLDEIKQAGLETSANQWREEIKPVVHDKYVEFRIPTDGELENVKMALKSKDGSKWWKTGNEDAEINFIKHNPIPAHPASTDPLPELVLAGKNSYKDFAAETSKIEGNKEVSLPSLLNDDQETFESRTAKRLKSLRNLADCAKKSIQSWLNF